jgi:hypothetical protein
MSNRERWVDPRVSQVRLRDLKNYLSAHGWTLKPFPRPQVLLFEEPSASGNEPIVQLVPSSEQHPDFRRGVIDTITSLSECEDRHPVEVLNDILRQDDLAGTMPNGPGAAAPAVGQLERDGTRTARH